MRHLLWIVVLVAALSGCQKPDDAKPTTRPTEPKSDVSDGLAAERAKLSAEDRAIVEAQEWCVVSTDEWLGAMGPPLKLDIKGQAVFVCCNGCKRKAVANPDKTLAKLTELRTKKAAEASK